MDETTLAYHTKLHQWYELHRLNRSGDMANLKLPEDGTHLTPQKAVEIDLWRKEVNKVFIKPRKPEKKPEFWRCQMSAPSSAKQYSFSADPRRVKSARFFSSRRNKQGGVDMNTLPSHLAEMSIHYNQERSKVYASRFSTEDLLIKGRKQELHQPVIMQLVNSNVSDDGNQSIRGHTKTDTQKAEKDCESTTQAGSGPSSENPRQETRGTTKALVGDRSASNNLLNVMSIDDCRMGVRYRPNRVINTHKLVIPSESSNNDNNVKLPPYPVHISDGSGVTPLSQEKLNSVLSAHRIKHKQIIVHEDDALPQRPHSAVLDRAFRTILQNKTYLQTPVHPKEIQFFACSKDSLPAAQGKQMYHRLNSTLKNKMTSVRNARWENLKWKESESARVQYGSTAGGANHRFSRRSTATDSFMTDDAKQL